MEEYRVTRSGLRAIDFHFSENKVDCLEINHYSWDSNGYKPKAECRIICCADGLKVRMVAFEKEIKATYTQMNDPVYKDSCLEFFVAPYENEPDYYYNFELNPLGTLLLEYGSKQLGRKLVIMENYKDYYQIKSEVHKNASWSVEFFIPFKFLNEYRSDSSGVIGQQMKANFYKCGYETQHPHYGCWSRIEMELPEFHQPKFFGALIIG